MARTVFEFRQVIRNITEEEQKWIEEELKEVSPNDLGEDGKEVWCKARGVPNIEYRNWPGFSWNIEKGNLYLCDKNGFYVEEYLCTFIWKFLKTFRKKDVVIITSSCRCSVDSDGGFGGEWIVISAGEIHTGNVWDAAAKAARYIVKTTVEPPLRKGNVKWTGDRS